MLKKVKTMMQDALGDASEFFNEHMKSMLYSPSPSFIMPQTEMFNPKMTKFYQQVFFNLPEYNKLINELYYNIGVIDSWKTSEKDISDTAAYIQTLDENEKKDILEKINKELRKNLLVKKHSLEISPNSPTFLKNQFGGGFPFRRRKREEQDEFEVEDTLRNTINEIVDRVVETNKLVLKQGMLRRQNAKRSTLVDDEDEEVVSSNDKHGLFNIQFPSLPFRRRKREEQDEFEVEDTLRNTINEIVDKVVATNKLLKQELEPNPVNNPKQGILQRQDAFERKVPLANKIKSNIAAVKNGLFAKLGNYWNRVESIQEKRAKLLKYLRKELPAIVTSIIYNNNVKNESYEPEQPMFQKEEEVYMPSFFLRELNKITAQDEILDYDDEDASGDESDVEPAVKSGKSESKQEGGWEGMDGMDGTFGKVANSLFGGGYTNEEKDTARKIKENEIQKVLNHPVFSPKYAETTITDRLIFMAVTYVIRGVCLFMLDWAINIKMVTTFQQAFNLYLTSYILTFLTLVILVNTSYSQTLNPFKLIFYYINTDINGSMRIIVHLAIQLFLLPIMFLAKDKVQGDENGVDTFDFRRKISRVISSVTMIIWLITSAVTLRL